MANREYSPEVKAAVMTALLAGQSVSEIAAEYKIPEGTLKTWKYRQVAEVDPEKKHEIGDLLLEFLRETLTTLREQAIHFRDKSWLSTQSAHELAILYGVEADKAIRLLEALARSNGGAGQQST